MINEIIITSARTEKNVLNLEWLLNGGEMPLYNRGRDGFCPAKAFPISLLGLSFGNLLHSEKTGYLVYKNKDGKRKKLYA